MAMKPFSKEHLNFFKFSTLVLDEFPTVLRQMFITMWDSKIATKPGFIVWDDSTKVRNLLLTSEGGKTVIPTTKSIEVWDCTALFKATIYAKTFGDLNDLYVKSVKPAPGSYHLSVQSSTGIQDETYALAIDQLRLLRNTLCHSPKPEISKTDFDHYVQLVKDALTAVAIDTSFVDDIGQMNEDDFPTEKVQELHECRMKELQAISMFHENVEQKLSSIEKQTEKLENVEQKLSSIEKQTEKLENVEQKLSSIEEQTEKVEQRLTAIDERTVKIENVEQKLSDIHAMVKNTSLEDKGNVPESLPRSYIPSAVPLFTGRKTEIYEITKLITGKSTRLLNIWGSPGFGKTSTAIQVAHHLLSLEYPVYFFKLQGISTVEAFHSQILSIFKGNVADRNLTPIDRLVSIFREISYPIFLVFDNLDDLLSHVSDAVATLLLIFDKFLNSNVNINLLLTTRELLETMRNEVTGFQDIRIRPLCPVSSAKFVRRLIPSFSESVATKVAEISSHVPLAMKLIASLVEGNSEDTANNILEDINRSENPLLLIDDPYERRIQKLFDTHFERLTANDKHALISLSVFSSAKISKNAAIDVVSGELGVKSLKTLVKKALIDEDLNEDYYSFHPLIYSFVVDKAKQSYFENVLNSSRIRFCRYYLLLFERFNDDFLAGKPVDSPKLQNTILHLLTAMNQSITNENFVHLFRILSKSEIFLFVVGTPSSKSTLDIHKLYGLAIEECKSQQRDFPYSKLYVSQYFVVSSEDIPDDIRKDAMLLSDGSAAKLGCYEGIKLLVKGNMKSGIQLIEEHLDGLQSSPDQVLVKCLCLQLLSLYYSDLKDTSSDFKSKAIEVCAEVGNYNLFLIDNCDKDVKQREFKGEQLILFIYIFCQWSEKVLCDETKSWLLSFVYKLQQEKENKVLCSYYLSRILILGDNVLASLGAGAGYGKRLDEKIDFLEDSLRKSSKKKDCTSLTADEIFQRMYNKTASLDYSPERLFICYMLRVHMPEYVKEGYSIDRYRKALDLSLKHDKYHENTALCYVKLGCAERAARNYNSALKAFDQALQVWTCIRAKGSSSNGRHLCESYVNIILNYLRIARVHYELGNNTQGVECLKNALKVSTKCEQERFWGQIHISVELVRFTADKNMYMELFNNSLPVIKETYPDLLPLFFLKFCINQLETGNYEGGLASFHEALNIDLGVTLKSIVDNRTETAWCYFDIAVTLLEMRKSKLAKRAVDRAFQIAETLSEGKRHSLICRCYFFNGHIHIEGREYVEAIESLKSALQLPAVGKLEEFDCRRLLALAYRCQRSHEDALSMTYDALNIIKELSPEGSEDEADTYRDVANIAQIMKNKSLLVNNLRLAYKMYSKVLGKNHSKTELSYIVYVRVLINN